MAISDERLTEIATTSQDELVQELVAELRRVRAVVRQHAGVQANRWPGRGAIVYPQWVMDLLGVPRPDRRR